jgi:hypothetical protein
MEENVRASQSGRKLLKVVDLPPGKRKQKAIENGHRNSEFSH